MESNELQIGTAGEHIVVADFLLNGISAFISNHGSSYDVVADHNGKLFRIQVKTTREIKKLTQRANPIYYYHIKRSGKNGKSFYKKNDFDLFALVALDIRKVFYIGFDEVKSNSICVRSREFDYSGNRGGGKKNGLYYQDLTWENYLSKNL